MIQYHYPEERIVALHFARELHDPMSEKLLLQGFVETSAEATHLSRFFWQMVEASARRDASASPLPCEGSAQYWTEKLYNTLGGYLERAGFGHEWDTEIDKA